MIETWKGRPVSELSKEELIEALNSLHSMMESQRVDHMQFVDTFYGEVMKINKPQSFFQWLFGAKQ